MPAEWFTDYLNHNMVHKHTDGYLKSRIIQKKNINAYASESNTLIIKVEGMTCNHCKMNVENSIRRLEFVESVEANVSKNTVSISGKI